MTTEIEINKKDFFDWIKRTEKDWLNIYIAGQVFGGRPNEAPQTPKDFQIIEDTLLITFSRTERLWVKKPVDIKIQNYKLTIQSATVVRWGWHYYGRPQTDLNWCEEIYIVNEQEIIKTDLTPLDGRLETQTKTIKLNSNFPLISISE
jgi:hypothetical protein